MDYQKEQTYNPRKTLTGCSLCQTVCSSCQGPCIFSKVYFKKCKDSKALKNRLQEKYYKEDFDLLRSLLPEEEQDISLKIKEELVNNNESEEYRLLERLHESPKDCGLLLDKHYTEYSKPNKEGKFGLTMKEHSVKGRCWWHREANKSKWINRPHKSDSRQDKKQRLMKENGQDFLME